MERSRLKQFIGISIIILFAVNTSFLFASNVDAKEPYITLICKYGGNQVHGDYCNLLKQHLARIGINLEVIDVGWPDYTMELLVYRDFDICYAKIAGGGVDPDFTGLYNENGSLNVYGYHTSMDYNETLGTGVNEWYMKEGAKMLPAYSQERIEHYWAWEQYLMDKILPCLPTCAPKTYNANWANLDGYNYTEGLLQSWGKMSWDGSHQGQENIDEVVISNTAWSNLGPMLQDDSSNLIKSALMDTMIYYDADMTPWPHLATNWTHITDTQVRVKLREGIKWQPDYEGNFTNEYFDARDVYFTFEIWNSYIGVYNDWFDHMEIVDDYTIDFFIDGDSSEPGAQLSTLYLPSFCMRILPEHYLNQTQLADGISPDITHPSWNAYAVNCFGTGLFTLSNYTEGLETILTVNSDCWQLNNSITSDPALDWERRFGDFSNSPNQLRIRIISSIVESIAEFKAGKVDIQVISADRYSREDFILDPEIDVQSDTQFYLGYFAFNMRLNRYFIGSDVIIPEDASMTRGLALRKAICYAADIEEINDIVHRGEFIITYHPIYLKMGIWCNPNIIKYEHDLSRATEYMDLAGFVITPYYTADSGINWFYSISGIIVFLGIMILIRKKR